MTDSSGTVVWSADYLPFGKPDVTVETVEINLRFAGQYYDSETGLHYNYHRYYDPTLGRYLRADPIGLRGGINPYTYVQNNPVNFIDPLGLLVDVIYNQTTGNITVTDRDTGQSITANAESGGKPFGDPIPKQILKMDGYCTNENLHQVPVPIVTDHWM